MFYLVYNKEQNRRPSCSFIKPKLNHGSSPNDWLTSIIALNSLSSLLMTAGDASVRGRLDGGREGGIPDSLPLSQVRRKSRWLGYVRRTCGPEQQIWCLLLQAQRYCGSTATGLNQRRVSVVFSVVLSGCSFLIEMVFAIVSVTAALGFFFFFRLVFHLIYYHRH